MCSEACPSLRSDEARISNCGDVLKLWVPSVRSKGRRGRGNDLGDGNNLTDVTMGNPQPSPKSLSDMERVHRLDGIRSRLALA